MLIDTTREQIVLRPEVEPKALLIRAMESENHEAILYDFNAEFGKDAIPPAFKSTRHGPGIYEWCVHRGLLLGDSPWRLTLYSAHEHDEDRFRQVERHALDIWVTHDAYDGWFVTIAQGQGLNDPDVHMEFTIPCPELDFYAVYRTPGQTDAIIATTPRPTAWEHLQREDA